MAVNSEYSPSCQEPTKYGLIHWQVAMPAIVEEDDELLLGALLELGTSTDTTEFRNIPFYNEIYSDAHGGQQGPPIDMQFLGHIVQFTIELTTFNNDTLELIRKRGFASAKGSLPQIDIGSNMFLRNSIRILANVPIQEDTRNFYCCVAREPFSIGYGTKWASWRIPVTAYRSPCYYPTEIAGVVEDTNSTEDLPS